MRAICGLLLALGTAGLCVDGARAAEPAQAKRPLTQAQRTLLDDIYAQPPTLAPRPAHRPSSLVAATLGVHADPRTVASTGQVFAMPAFTGSGLDQRHLLDPEQLVPGEGLAVWRTNEVSYAHGRAVDTVRVSVAGVARGRGGVVSANPDALLDPDAEAFDVSFTRGWPAAWTMSAGKYAVDVSPHAGLGVTSTGETAEAGAMVRVSRDLERQVAERLGVKTIDRRAFSEGRWFVFAAVSGTAVGVNMAPSPGQSLLQRTPWATETSNALVSDAQAGIGWRRGPMQASVGYVHRDVKSQMVLSNPNGPASYHDSMVAVSLSLSAR
jgi:hypothetical protein